MKSELENFGDCEACGGRTCYVCMRECLEPLGINEEHALAMSLTMDSVTGIDEDAWRQSHTGLGHRRKICSECCVEEGPEGEVWCLGCLRAKGGD
jgi:hypothetical protein